MKAGPVTVRQLLENRQRFCVPIYQRHYVWQRDKQWEPFWNDVRTKAIERLNGRERRFSHFMGAVVLEARGAVSSRQVTSFQVVDGQQRLTTFQMYLAAARDYAQQAGFEDTVGLIEGYLFNEKEHLMEDPEIERFKVWPTKFDRQLFQDIVTIGRTELRRKYRAHFYKGRDKIYDYSTVPNLLGAYGYFFDRIKHAVESDAVHTDAITAGTDDASHVGAVAGSLVRVHSLAIGIGSVRVEVKASRNGTGKFGMIARNAGVQNADGHAFTRKAQRIGLGGVDHVQAGLTLVFFAAPFL